MRILFVNERLGYFGGVEQNVADVAEALTAAGHTCFLAYGFETGRDIPEYNELFSYCFRVRELMPKGIDRRAVSFADALDVAAPDVVYVHKVPAAAFVLKYRGRVRLVRMVHDHDLCCPRTSKYFALNGRVCPHPAGWRCWVDGAFLRRAPNRMLKIGFTSVGAKLREMHVNETFDALLVGSAFMRNELIQNGYPPAHVYVVPPFVPAPQGAVTPVPEQPRVLYVGQLIRGKGVDLLLRALALLQTRFEAKIIGTGNAESRLKDLSKKLGLQDRVHFEGWMDNDALAPIYAGAKVVAVPSRWPEPFGMVGLEAMHHARPVVGFAVGAIPEWLRDGRTGYVVPEQDVAGFARALERLLTDTDLASRMGAEARRVGATEFSFERYVRNLESILAPAAVPEKVG